MCGAMHWAGCEFGERRVTGSPFAGSIGSEVAASIPQPQGASKSVRGGDIPSRVSTLLSSLCARRTVDSVEV